MKKKKSREKKKNKVCFLQFGDTAYDYCSKHYSADLLTGLRLLGAAQQTALMPLQLLKKISNPNNSLENNFKRPRFPFKLAT